MKLVPVRIHNRHAPQPLEILVRRFLDLDTFLPELTEPRVNIRNVQMNEAAGWAVASVFGQKERKPVARHLHESRKTWFEPVFPVDPESEAIDVEAALASPVAQGFDQSSSRPLDIVERLDRLQAGHVRPGSGAVTSQHWVIA